MELVLVNDKHIKQTTKLTTMKQITKTYTVYSFDELSEDAQQKAIEKLYDINVNYDWSGLTIDEQQSRLIELGFNEPLIMFSGFSSQGDGACFTCESIDFNIFLNGKYKGLDISANITHNWRYYFASSTTVNLNVGNDISDELFSEIEKAIEDEREKLGNDIYRILEKEYEYLTSTEAIKETIEANEYTFLEDGTLKNF